MCSSDLVMVSSINLIEPDKFLSCKVGDKVRFKGVLSGTSDKRSLKVTEIISVGIMDTRLFITESGFRGIYVGDAIEKLGDFVKKTTMKTGEGDFDVYKFTDIENNPAGYFMADPNNKLSVGDITIETPKASTEAGIKVGDTFKDLLKAYPNIEVHGSEVESRTYAKAGKLSFRLNVANNKYDLDRAKIPATAKITEIVINRVTNQTADLATKYNKIQPNEYCWQTNKVLDLHTQPSADSKVEGRHFAGEVLKVLGTKTIKNQLWVNVTYSLKVKAGYEDQFADGRVTPSGQPTGWIGGVETPKINCK